MIALVITIIVLLILAGVTIITLTGENGILKRATTAGEKTNEEIAKEELKLLITEARLDLASQNQIINPNIEDVAKWIKDNYDTEIDMTITYKKTSTVIIEDNGITTDIDFAEIQYKGYKFVLKKDLTIDDSKTDTSETRTYTITYDANGGTGAPTEQKKTHGQALTLSTQVPTKLESEFLGWSKDKNATTAQYAKGANYTEEGNATLYAIWEAVPTAATKITTANYGESVNYSANGVTDWKVFHKDTTHVYIITSDYLPVVKVPTISGILTTNSYGVYGSSRDQLVNGLKDTTKWSVFVNGITEATATGSPTAELFMQSYNKKHNTNLSYTNSPTIDNTDTLYVPHSSSYNSCNGYWLASPDESYATCLWRVGYGGNVDTHSYSLTTFSVRPVVSLPSSVKAIKGSDGKWTFSN